MIDFAAVPAMGFFETLVDSWEGGVGLRSMLEMLLVAPVVGALGVWVTVSRLSYLAESFSHSLLPGTVAAGLIGLPIVAGAPVAAAVCASALGYLLARRHKFTIGRDSAIAVVVTTMLALGIAIALIPSSPPRLQELLFGNVLGVTSLDLLLTASLAALALIGLWIFHRNLMLTVFDRQTAHSLGVSARSADTLLLVLIAIAVTVAVQGLGNLLIAGLLLAPASAASQFASSVRQAFLLATSFAATAGVGGLYLSYYAKTAVGSSICLTALSIFVVTRLAATRYRTTLPVTDTGSDL